MLSNLTRKSETALELVVIPQNEISRKSIPEVGKSRLRVEKELPNEEMVNGIAAICPDPSSK